MATNKEVYSRGRRFTRFFGKEDSQASRFDLGSEETETKWDRGLRMSLLCFTIHQSGEGANMANWRAIVLALGGAALLPAGCIPYLDRGILLYGVKGQLQDDATGKPLAKTNLVIESRAGYPGFEFGGAPICRETTTDKEGTFAISPEHEIYWTWYICGPVLAPPYMQEITVKLEKFQTLRIVAVRGGKMGKSLPDNARNFAIDEDCRIMLGPIRMKKR